MISTMDNNREYPSVGRADLTLGKTKIGRVCHSFMWLYEFKPEGTAILDFSNAPIIESGI